MERPVLYRCRTPTDRLCPCGRAARALAAHGIEHDVVRLPRGRDGRAPVMGLTGQRHVPVLVIEGQAIADSRRIVEHLRWRATGGSA